MKKKKYLAALVFLLLLALAACGRAEEPSQAPPAPEETELLIAVFEGGYGRAYWDAIAGAFEEEHPGVHVEVMSHPEIGEIIRPNVIAGNPPDFIYLPSTNNSYVTRGMTEDHAIADITDVMEGIQDRFLPGFLESRACQPYGDGRIYLAPVYYSATGLWYNRDYFEREGLSVPATWEAFFDLGERGKETLHRSLFTYQGLYPTYFECMLIPAITSSAGVEAMNACENFETGAWSNPAVVGVLRDIACIGREGYLLPGSTAFDHIQAQSCWLMGEALFHPNGGWVESEMKDYPREAGFEFGFAVPPAVPGEGEKYIYTAIDEMYIPAAAKNKELSKQFLAFQYSDEAIELNARLANGVPPVRGAAQVLKQYASDAVYQSCAVFDHSYRPYITNYAMLPEGEEVPRDVVYNNIGSVLDGSLSVEDWVAQLEEVSAAVQKNKQAAAGSE